MAVTAYYDRSNRLQSVSVGFLNVLDVALFDKTGSPQFTQLPSERT